MRVRDLLPACFLVFTALLMWPLLGIPNRPALIAGVPALVHQCGADSGSTAMTSSIRRKGSTV